MHTEDLEAFFSVVESGSLTAAAHALGVPKSTISRRLARLESDLGATLLMRTPRATQITETGELLYQGGAPALAHLAEVQRMVTDRAAQPSGPLRVSAPTDLAAVHLGPLCAQFVLAHPKIELTVVASQERANVIGEGFDVVLRAHIDPLPSVSSLRARKLTGIDVKLYASPDYLDTHGRPRQPTNLEQHRWVAISVVARGWKMGNARTGKSAEISVRPSVVCNDHLLIRDVALGGAGIAVLPTFLAEPHVREGRLERVLAGWCIQSATLSAVWPATHHTSPRVRAFVDAAAAYFEPPPWARE